MYVCILFCHNIKPRDTYDGSSLKKKKKINGNEESFLQHKVTNLVFKCLSFPPLKLRLFQIVRLKEETRS